MTQWTTPTSGESFDPSQPVHDEGLGGVFSREWLVTNGLGGYASGTVVGGATRRYHGLLVAALGAPRGRTVMLNHLTEEIRAEGREVARLEIGTFRDHNPQGVRPHTFHLEAGLPVWRYAIAGARVEKRLLMPYGQNTVYVSYRLLEGADMRLRLRPAVHFRSHEAPINQPLAEPYSLRVSEGHFEIRSGDEPPLRMEVMAANPTFVADGGCFRELQYPVEQSRGYESSGSLWSPGYFRVDLHVGAEVLFMASAESWETLLSVEPRSLWEAETQRRKRLVAQACSEVREGAAAQLVLAADQFIIRPAARLAEATLARASADDVRTIIAGYHWFTDWGRDTMISLEGLTLVTGRHREAGYVLRSFARCVRDGLIPNLFPEGGRDGLYHTADATLWFFHALHRYLVATNDRATLEQTLPVLQEIVERHVAGTRFGIGVDPSDGLLRQGEEGYQLTWMDAKVGDWVVTPRRGKAVEINALWYNALRLLEQWLRETGQQPEADDCASRAEQARRSFNSRFCNPAVGHLYDVVDGEAGDDAALRPNQVFALSLDHPVLDREWWQPVVDCVGRELLTPFGLRSLARGHADYKPRYDGDLRARDAAYHQGTVWAWLIGPYIDAYLRVYPDRRAEARRMLAGFMPHLDHSCVGSVSEVFDAEPPYHPRGCVAQAWSVAELLRCLVRTGPPLL
jgi:predicted glycogen debranching enzyme